MADLSKIKLNGTTYNFKDTEARQLVSDLEDSIPEVPSVLSELVNDVGYITSYTEIDPTVPSWAKASSKPTYTANEVGALANDTKYVTGLSIANHGEDLRVLYSDNTHEDVLSIDYASYNHTHDTLQTTAGDDNTEYNLIGTAITNTNTSAVNIYQPTLLSFSKYASNFARLTLGSTSTPGIVRIYTNASGASGFTDIKSNASSTNERTVTFPDASGTVALTTDIPSVPSWALANNKPSYTFSELTSHPTTLNDYGITNAYTKTEVDGLVSGVLHYKGTKSTTSALPSSGNITGDVWHITADGSEWAWDGSAWEELGTTVDLSGYLQTSDIAAWAKAANKPTYTANEVGALASNTTYVSTFNGQSGAITYIAPVTSVNGQTGAVTLTIPDADDHKWNDVSLTKTSQALNGADMYVPYLSNTTATTAKLILAGNGRVANTIATYNSNGYLLSTTPSANDNSTKVATTAYVDRIIYDDTALAARVSALEQIPWVTYYTGSSTPNNSQGNNGDLYFQTAQ